MSTISYYTLSSAEIARLQRDGQRFRLYAAVHDPVAITVFSRDLTNNSGNVTIPTPIDALATSVAPYVPIVNMGSNRIGFVGEPLYFDGLLSVQRGNILAFNHQWSMTGPGTLTTYATAIPFPNVIPGGAPAGPQQCSIVWSAPGNYTVTLSVQDRYGHISAGTRQVRIYPDRQTAPAQVVAVGQLSGDLSSGGWQVQVTTLGSMPGLLAPESVPIGSYLPLTILLEVESDVAPGVAEQQTNTRPWGEFVSGQPYRDPRILFSGYVTALTVQEDEPGRDVAQISAITAQQLAQEANVLTTGYYNATYAGTDSQGRWNSLATLAAFQGVADVVIADLQATDLYHSLLADRATILQYHDAYFWATWLQDVTAPNYMTARTYSTLSVNEDSVWSGIAQVVQNEQGSAWCDSSSAFHIGPTINAIGPSSWTWWYTRPAVGAVSPLPGYPPTTQTLWPPDTAAGTANTTPYSLAFPPYNGVGMTPYTNPQVLWIDPWHIYSWRNEFYSGLLNGNSAYNSGLAPPGQQSWMPTLQTLFGMHPCAQPVTLAPTADRNPMQALILPIVAHIADETNDPLSLLPTTLEIDETYLGRPAFVKLIGYHVQGENGWGGTYPPDVFDVNGVMQGRQPGGTFTVTDQLVLPDFTDINAQNLGWQALWEQAYVMYLQALARYTAIATLAGNHSFDLHWLIWVSREHGIAAPNFARKLFTITNISHTLSTQQNTWTVQITANEVTSIQATAMIVPPYDAPPLGTSISLSSQ